MKLCEQVKCNRKYYGKGLCKYHWNIKWQNNNRDKMRQCVKNWSLRNPEKILESYKKRMSKIGKIFDLFSPNL